MISRLHHLQHQNRLSKLKIERLRSKIASIIESRSVPTDEGTSSDLEAIMHARGGKCGSARLR